MKTKKYLLAFMLTCSVGCNRVTSLANRQHMNQQKKVHNMRNPLLIIGGVAEYYSGNSNLPGVKEDMKLFYDLFYDFFGYEVHSTHKSTTLSNPFGPKASELKEFYQKYVPKSRDHGYDGLFVLFSGHGSKDTIYGSDKNAKDAALSFSAIEDMFDKSFVGLPKIFLKLACNGWEKPVVVHSKKNQNPPNEKNFSIDQDYNLSAEKYTVSASPKGQVSYDRSNGCYPAQYFCSLMKKQKHRSLRFRAFIEVLRDTVLEKSKQKELVADQQCTLTTDTYFKKRYLQPGLNFLSVCNNIKCTKKNKGQWINKGMGTFFMDWEFLKNQCSYCQQCFRKLYDIVFLNCKYDVDGDYFIENSVSPNTSKEFTKDEKTIQKHESLKSPVLEKVWEYLSIHVSNN